MADTYLNQTGLALVWEKIKNKLAGKVDVVSGKGLSTNDYTSAEKTKLAGIATGAQVNVLEGVQKNGVSISPTNKIVNIIVPTKTSELTNDSDYLTYSSAAATATPKMDGAAAVGTGTTFARADHVHPHDTTKADKASSLSGYGITNAYTKSEVDSKIASATAGITGISFAVAESLPESGNNGTIYLVADTHSDAKDSYDEYIYVNNAWEKLGNTDVDLSGYQPKMTALTESDINKICV